MVFVRTFCILLLVQPIFSLGQAPCAFDQSTCDSRPLAGLRSIYEVVNPTQDGNTVTYRLNSIPSLRAPLHIALKGRELSLRTEYTITGREVSLSEQAQASPGDDIQAAYSIETNVDNSGKLPDQTQHTEGSSSAMLERYLQQALDAAIATTLPTSVTGNSGELSPAMTRSTKRSTELPSLRMLSAAVDRAAPSLKQARHRPKAGPTANVSAAGVDGYGDAHIESPFDLLAASPNESSFSRDTKASTGEAGATRRIVKRSNVPRSLAMLGTAISDSK